MKTLTLTLALTLTALSATAQEVFFRTNAAGDKARAIVLEWDNTKAGFVIVKNGATFSSMTEVQMDIVRGFKDAQAEANESAAFLEGKSLLE